MVTALLVMIVIVRYASIMLAPIKERPTEIVSFPRVERGTIFDRAGRLLAQQTMLRSISAWLPHITDPEETSQILGRILNQDPQSLLKKFRGEKSEATRFVYVKRKATPTETTAIEEAQKAGQLVGISLQPEYGRNYPERELAAHLIGYVGIDNIGLEGVEYTFNDQLSPPAIGQGATTTVHGNQLYLTIDIDAQYMVERIAQEAFHKHKADSVIVLVMEAKTGEILTYASLPSFDPNSFQEYSEKERRNLPVTETYEPGSVFKIFSLATFFDEGAINEDTIFETNGVYEPETFRKHNIAPIRDLENFGKMRPVDALIFSSNVGISYASESISRETLYKKLKAFGFGERTGVPLPGESYGIVNDLDQWTYRSKPTISFGQEIGISTMQILAAATVLANRGVLLRPHIVKKVISPSGEIIKEYTREPVRQVISPEVAERMLLMMEQTVIARGGTGRKAHIPGLRISAKSGTAETLDLETGQYSKKRYIGSVLAILPTEDPRLIVYIVFGGPKGPSIFGGQIASPLIKKIVRSLTTLYEISSAIPPYKPKQGATYEREPLPKVYTHIPDFKGYAKREILSYLHRGKIPYRVVGEGWVVFQFPPAGEEITEETTLYLEFQ